MIDRWAREVLYPSLFGRFGNPAPPRVLSLSSTHTALLLRHLGARDRVVGCDAWFEETPGRRERVNAPIPRVVVAPDLDVIEGWTRSSFARTPRRRRCARRASVGPSRRRRAERDERRGSPVGRDAADDGEARSARREPPPTPTPRTKIPSCRSRSSRWSARSGATRSSARRRKSSSSPRTRVWTRRARAPPAVAVGRLGDSRQSRARVRRRRALCFGRRRRRTRPKP